jgi:hypothetical protein
MKQVFEKGRINCFGYLEVARKHGTGWMMAKNRCPYNYEHDCGAWCMLFSEPYEVYDEDRNEYLIAIDLCKKQLLFHKLIDERGSTKNNEDY